MSLITMCCHDTEENGRTELTERTLVSLFNTVIFAKHRLIIIDNDSCKQTKALLESRKNLYGHFLSVITNSENIGTSRGLNLAWKERRPGEHVIKIDNDVVIHQSGWVDQMEEAIERDPQIGIIGLKRKDLIQSPDYPDPQYRSELISLPHELGQRWITIERTPDIIGTCTMFNYKLLDKVGYSFQFGKYGFEDALFCHRSHLAGFYNCFLPHIEIDHIDPGQNEYIIWKRRESSKDWEKYKKHVQEMIEGKQSIYYNPFE